MNSEEILDGAIEIVKKGWTQGNLATGHNCYPVPPNSKMACRWCLVGSLIKAGNVPSVYEWNLMNISNEMKLVVEAIRAETGALSLVEWNDAPNRYQRDIVTMLERTKKRVRGFF